jgi:Na+-transporting NADH:ubiquinone oxidoreductase subunit C
MAINTDKNSYTVLFSVIMVIVVGSLLAGIAQGFKGKIDENKRIEKQQNILYAMGVHNNEGDSDVIFISADEVNDVFNEYIKKQLVIQGDQVTEDPEAYLIDLKQEEAKAKNKKEPYERRLPLFIGEKEGKSYYIIPMRGKGLWDAIWGFVSLDEDLIVQGIFFDHKGETPGLGSNIKERYFMDDFHGESLFDGDTFKGIDVAKGNNDPLNKDKKDNEVDALAGATITGNGLAAMIKKDLRMYLPYLKNIKN